MNPWTDDDRNAFSEIDQALHNIELNPAPPGLMKAVMRRVGAEKPLTRFRLTWMDYALSLFTAGMVALAGLLTRSLPPEVELYLRLELLYWFEHIRLDPVSPFYLIGAAALLVGGIGALIVVALQLITRLRRSIL